MIRKAIENREFRLYIQPQIDLISSKLTGAEALIRWEHPEKGLISPAEFIPIAENTSLIIEITDFVLTEAASQMVKWRAKGFTLPKISINLSGRDIKDDNLVKRVKDILEKSLCNPEWIELEITEGFIMHEPEETIIKLNELRAINMQISIDDFGTGYSSLSYLKKLPITKLKIDQSFVRDMEIDSDDRAIIKTTIALAKSMGLTVIAEGVEREEQHKLLQLELCDEMQGYLFSKPLNRKDMGLFLSK